MSFLRPIDPPQSILLEICPKEQAESINDLCMSLTRAKMTEVVKLYVPLAAQSTLTFGPKYFTLTKTLNEWLTDRYRGLINLQRELLPHLLYEPNLKLAAKAWPRNFRSAITYALNNVFIGLEKVMEIISENPVKIKLQSGRESYVTPIMITSAMDTDLSCTINIYSLTPQVAYILGRAMEMKSYCGTSSTTDILPEQKLETFSGEGEIIGKFEVFKSIVKNNEIYMTGSGTGIKVGDVNTIAAALNFADPFSVSNIKYLKKFRVKAASFLLLTSLSSYPGQHSLQELPSTPELLRNGLRYVDYSCLANCAMPYFDKFGKTSFNDIRGRIILNVINSKLAKYAIKNLPADKKDVWINVDELVDEIFADMDITNKFGIDISVVRGFQGLFDNLSMSKVNLQNLVTVFTKQLLRGILAVYASAGMVEIAFSPSTLSSNRPFESIKFVRLSGLGRFITGVDSEYVPRDELKKAKASVELDHDNLILRILNDEAAQFVKNNIGKKISSNRYLVDEITLSRKIQSNNDLDNRIMVLKEMASISELPPIWQALTEQVKRHISALKSERLSDWLMYSLNGRLPELAELLRTDSTIRKMILMVEGGRFLVRRSDFENLSKLLANYGFTLPEPFSIPIGYWSRR